MKTLIRVLILLPLFQNTGFANGIPSSSLCFTHKYHFLMNGGLSAISYNNGSRLRLGAITPSIHLFIKRKYSLHAEYYHFDYFYGGMVSNEKMMKRHGYTFRIESKSAKLAAGYILEKKNFYFNPYVSLNYRYSKSGHQFHWPVENNPRTELFYASSPFRSAGIGLGASANVVLFAHLHAGFDCSFSRYFDKRKILARSDTYSLDTVDVSDAWVTYQPLNQVLALQAKLGFLF